MSACPNTNDQAWKDLVIALNSEADAMTAFVRNGNETPSVGTKAFYELAHVPKSRSFNQVAFIIVSIFRLYTREVSTNISAKN